MAVEKPNLYRQLDMLISSLPSVDCFADFGQEQQPRDKRKQNNESTPVAKLSPHDSSSKWLTGED